MDVPPLDTLCEKLGDEAGVADSWLLSKTPRLDPQGASTFIGEEEKDASLSPSKSIIPLQVAPIYINAGVFETCCEILEGVLRPLEDSYLDDQGQGMTFNGNGDETSEKEVVVTALQWETLTSCSIWGGALCGLDSASASSVSTARGAGQCACVLDVESQEPVDAFLR